MPSLSRSLEQALHRAIRLASERHHEYATLEHLLLQPRDLPMLPDPGPVQHAITEWASVRRGAARDRPLHAHELGFE